MSFSYTINHQSYAGPGIRKIYGTWSGSAGDAAGTIAIAGRVREAVFQKTDSDDTYEIIPRVKVSTSSGIDTVTIDNQDNVTNGIFEMTVLGH